MNKQTMTTTTDQAPGPRARGTIQHLYPERGFGFIRCTDGADGDVGEDFFFHHSGLVNARMEDLLPGSVVLFESTEVPRGKRAERVQLQATPSERMRP